MEILKLNPHFSEKIWGTDNLEPYGFTHQHQKKIGETWVISAHPHGPTTFKNGQALATVFNEKPHWFNHYPGVYPLLAKIITPTDYLSVQVHPDDAYAQAHHQALGKPESWYVLDAPEGAELIYGHTARTKTEVQLMIQENQWDQLLTKIPVKKGNFIYVPPGKIHAISPGVVVCEIQRSSDITYRLYDFGRLDANQQPRPLHLADSLANISVPDSPPVVVHKECGLLIDTPEFTIYLWDVAHEPVLDLQPYHPYWLQLVAVAGTGTINHHPLALGEAALAVNGLEPLQGTGNLKILISWVKHR